MVARYVEISYSISGRNRRDRRRDRRHVRRRDRWRDRRQICQHILGLRKRNLICSGKGRKKTCKMSSVNQKPLPKHFQRREYSEHKWHFFNSHFYVFFWYFSFPKSKLGFFMDIKIQNINDIFFNSWNLDGEKKKKTSFNYIQVSILIRPFHKVPVGSFLTTIGVQRHMR